MGPMVLFTHLKNILLQCFQFSVFSIEQYPNRPLMYIISIEFSRFGTFCNFSLNFHDFTHSTNLNFSTNSDDQYISTQFSI